MKTTFFVFVLFLLTVSCRSSDNESPVEIAKSALTLAGYEINFDEKKVEVIELDDDLVEVKFSPIQPKVKPNELEFNPIIKGGVYSVKVNVNQMLPLEISQEK